MFSVSSQPPRSINLNVKPLLATTRLTPVPSQPLIHNLSPTTSNPFQDWKQNQILDNATAIFWNALNPRPLRSLELGDIERSTECLEIWEEHDEKGFGVLADLRGVTGGYLIVDTLFAFRHALRIQTVPMVDMDAFHLRVRAILDRLVLALLQEKRRAGTDTGLLSSWFKQINKDVLQVGVQSVHWSTTELPFILDLLEIWPCEELDLDSVKNSNILQTITRLATIPCIPTTRHNQNPRSRAVAILKKWQKVSIGTREDVELDPPAYDTQADNVPLECRLGEIADVLQRLSASAEAGDSKAVLTLSGTIMTWNDQITDPSLKMSVVSAITIASKKFSIAEPDSHPALERLEQLLDIFRTGPPPTSAPGFAGFSYYPANPPQDLDDIHIHESPTLTFVDMTWSTIPEFSDSCSMRPTPGKWDAVTLPCCSLDEPLQSLFERFFACSNEMNRHPLFPSKNCTFTLKLKDRSVHMHVTCGQWAQGSLRTFVSAEVMRPGREHGFDGRGLTLEVPYTRGPEYDMSERSPQVLSLPAWKRILPPTIVTPAHWIEPCPPHHPTHYSKMKSLCFVGSGSEFHPRIAYPPVIASHIWIPRKWEKLGLKAWNLRTRTHCEKVAVEKRWVLDDDERGWGLTEDEARSMVGRTVQYAETRSEEKKERLRRMSHNSVQKKHESEDMQDDSSPDSEVFVAYVWGFDPVRMILKAFENHQSTDVCRTFRVGTKEQTDTDIPRREDLPSDFPEVRAPVRPLWIGIVEVDLENE